MRGGKSALRERLLMAAVALMTNASGALAAPLPATPGRKRPSPSAHLAFQQLFAQPRNERCMPDPQVRVKNE